MAANNLYPSFLDTSSSTGPSSNTRATPLPVVAQQQANNVNGNGAAMNGLPMIAGQQMDVNYLFQKVSELSEILRQNRERTQGIVAGAEELAVRCSALASRKANDLTQAHRLELQPMAPLHPYKKLMLKSAVCCPLFKYTSHIIIFLASRIADLERRLANEQNKVRVLIQEQKENTTLIGEWEHEVGRLVEKVREHTFDNKAELHAQARHYNNLLQEEKDAHLQARQDKDEWHAKFMRSAAMMREAYRLRSEEEEAPLRVVGGLQNEVRALRSALGMEAEKPEEEFGWDILKDSLGKDEEG